MINYAPHETSTAPWKLLWWRTSALARSRISISVWPILFSPPSSPVHSSCQACPGWLSQSPSVSAVWDSSLVNRAHWHCGACASIATFMAHQSCLSPSFSLSLFLSPLLRHRPLTFIDFNGPGFAQWLPRLAGHGQPGKEPQPQPAHKVPSTPLTQQFALSSADALS